MISDEEFRRRGISNTTPGMPRTYICVCGHRAIDHSLYRQSLVTPSAPNVYEYYGCDYCDCLKFLSEYDKANIEHAAD